MSQELSAPALIECVRRYYPLELPREAPRYTQSEEHQRLEHRLREVAGETASWHRFVQQVEESFPGCNVIDTTSLPHHPSYRCKVLWGQPRARLERTREDVIVCMLSALAPVYALHASHYRDDGTKRESWMRYPPLPTGFQPYEDTLARLMESTMGATRLPNEVLFTRVPGIRPRANRPQHRAPWLVELLF
jgi:hypothetical protein